MAIGISSFISQWNEALAEKNIPELESYYEKYWAGNYKGGVKISMPWKDKQFIQNNYVSS
jgi:hypothetical protein